MAGNAAWVDELCDSLHLQGVSQWLPWSRREQGGALGANVADPNGVAGVYLIGWGASEADIELLYVGVTGRARARLSHLEDQVKWGMDYGFGALRNLLEQREDHRTMRKVWLKMICIEEKALFPSPLLGTARVNALGAFRRHLQVILLAEHHRRFGMTVPGNRELRGLFLNPATPVAEGEQRPQVAA
jgi:hypothetical protein